MKKLLTKHQACYGMPLQEDDTCGKCANFVRPNRCRIVAGDVRAHGSCDSFLRRPHRMQSLAIVSKSSLLSLEE